MDAAINSLIMRRRSNLAMKMQFAYIAHWDVDKLLAAVLIKRCVVYMSGYSWWPMKIL